MNIDSQKRVRPQDHFALHRLLLHFALLVKMGAFTPLVAGQETPGGNAKIVLCRQLSPGNARETHWRIDEPTPGHPVNRSMGRILQAFQLIMEKACLLYGLSDCSRRVLQIQNSGNYGRMATFTY